MTDWERAAILYGLGSVINSHSMSVICTSKTSKSCQLIVQAELLTLIWKMRKKKQHNEVLKLIMCEVWQLIIFQNIKIKKSVYKRSNISKEQKRQLTKDEKKFESGY